MTANFRFKTIGKVNKWNVLTGEFELGTPLGDTGIKTNSTTLTNELIEAMKNRDNISITIGGEE